MKVPSTDPARDKLLAGYRKKLAYFQSIPQHRREAECADQGEATCRALLSELEHKP